MSYRVKRTEEFDEPVQMTVEVEGQSYTFGVNETKNFLDDTIGQKIADKASDVSITDKDKIRADRDPFGSEFA